jgi:uncharacterized SAM-binding protein YcdF (DUF218 family)
MEHGVTTSLIIVTSNYHMPRALVEISAALPGVALHPFPVVSDQLHVEDWPRNIRVARLIGGEYVKYLFALARTMLVDASAPSPRKAPNSHRADKSP